MVNPHCLEIRAFQEDSRIFAFSENGGDFRALIRYEPMDGDLFLRPEVRWKGENEPMVFNFAAGTTIPVAFFLSTLACMAQKPQNDELAKPINMGVPEAMLDAGNRGAVELIPLLREHLTDKAVPRYELSGKWEQAEAAQ